MSKYIISVLIILAVYAETAYGQSGQSNFSKTSQIEAKINELVKTGVPGAAISVRTPEGWYEYAAGYASLKNMKPMTTNHYQYLQSISKVYMATEILKLYEEGKINLDQTIDYYLPESIIKMVGHGDKITVKMLLNHTSGLTDYNFSPNYVAYYLQHPTYAFSKEEFVSYIKNKPLDFIPGSKYSYRNINYVLLAIIADEITGNHIKYMEDEILRPLGLNETIYHPSEELLNSGKLVNSYWDRHSNSIVEDATEMQRANVATMVGDDGLVATPKDAVRFLKALLEGEILNERTLKEMKTFVKNEKGEAVYGLGLGYNESNNRYGHSGGGVGSGCVLYYHENNDTYYFMAINLGTVTDSPIHDKAGPIVEDLYKILSN